MALSFNLEAQDKRRASSIRRQHLSILYLLNDLLHQLKYHGVDQSRYQGFVEGIYRCSLDCLGNAAAYQEKLFPRHRRRIDRLLKEWSRHHYFEPKVQKELEQTANNAASTGTAGAVEPVELTKREEPFIMPAVHGDPSAPYHELPAANLMPHIVTNTSIPINPHHVRALQFTPGPAEPALVEVVKSFLKDIDLLYGTMIPEDEGISMELDDLGQKITRDKQNGLVLSMETYYGWSKEFCENMRRKQNNQRRSRSGSSGSSRGRRSMSPRKRMRYRSRDASGNRQRSRNESYSRSRSVSRSRSRSPPRQGMGSRRLRSLSRSHSRSPSRPRFSPKFQSGTLPKSLPSFSSETSSRTPSTMQIANQQDTKIQNLPSLPVQERVSNQQVYLPAGQTLQNLPPPPPMPSSNTYHGNTSIPPPRPLNWQGTWLPPPPPPPNPPSTSMPTGQIHGMYQPPHYPAQQYQYASTTNPWHGMPPIPPPPPPPPQSGETYNGHGYGKNYMGNGGSNGQNDSARGGNRW